MTLKDYIQIVLDGCDSADIAFEVSLYSDGSVSDVETGNKVKFTVAKLPKLLEDK